jgi:hypothetical protein
MPIILATQTAEIRRIPVQRQPRQIVPGDPISKKCITKKAGEVAQGVGPDFTPQYCKKKKKRRRKRKKTKNPIKNVQRTR